MWGPSKFETNSKSRWFVTFIDDHIQVTWVFLMKEKFEVFTIFKNFHAFIQNQFQTSIKILQSDNRREYLNSNFQTYLEKHGIDHKISCAYSPQQNGVSERKNGCLLEVARALMIGGNVPNNFLGDAILTFAYLISRLPSKTLNFQTPLHKFLEIYPNSHLTTTIPKRVLECTTFVYNEVGGKLDSHAIKCVFLGYSCTQKGYKCYSPVTNRVYVTMNVKFVENQPFFNKSPIQGGERDK